MINKEKTIQVHGVDPDTLAPTSNQKVWWKCDNTSCSAPTEKKEREFSYSYARKKREKALKDNPENPVELCQVCAHAHRKGTVAKKREDSIPAINLADIQEVNVEKTQDLFGYNPMNLKPWSRKKVVMTCSETGKECTTQRCGLNRNKGILEKGKFISTGAYTGARRRGVKVSAETKEAMAQSQQARRQREKAKKEKQVQENSVQTVPVLDVEA